MDEARKKTDKILHAIEKEIGRVYVKSPALSRTMKNVEKYMKYVEKATESSYRAYVNESDINVREEKKKAYMNEIRGLTLESRKFRSLMKEFSHALAVTNQEALARVNASMPEIYMVNYNQVAGECRKAGIKVNGKED